MLCRKLDFIDCYIKAGPTVLAGAGSPTSLFVPETGVGSGQELTYESLELVFQLFFAEGLVLEVHGGGNGIKNDPRAPFCLVSNDIVQRTLGNEGIHQVAIDSVTQLVERRKRNRLILLP